MDITTHNATGLKVNARKGCTSGGDDYLVVSIIITKEDGLEEIAIFTENVEAVAAFGETTLIVLLPSDKLVLSTKSEIAPAEVFLLVPL